MQGGTHTISLIGALHGELEPLATLHALVPLDSLAAKLADRGIPPSLMQLGKLGTAQQMYIPWMQATYFMVANKQALPYLPKGADINALTYDAACGMGRRDPGQDRQADAGLSRRAARADAPFHRRLPVSVLHRRLGHHLPQPRRRRDVDQIRGDVEGC